MFRLEVDQATRANKKEGCRERKRPGTRSHAQARVFTSSRLLPLPVLTFRQCQAQLKLRCSQGLEVSKCIGVGEGPADTRELGCLSADTGWRAARAGEEGGEGAKRRREPEWKEGKGGEEWQKAEWMGSGAEDSGNTRAVVL